MKKNFVVDNSVALEGNDFYYDLHNSYVVSNINLSPDKKTLKIVLERLNGNWIKETDPKKIELVFENINFLDVSSNFDHLPQGIEEIGYKNEGDFDYDWLMNEDADNDHLVLRLVNDEYLRVLSGSAKVYPS